MTTVRTVIDPTPGIGASRCCQPTGDSLCWLPKGHRVPCFPLHRAPVSDVTDANPAYDPRSAA